MTWNFGGGAKLHYQPYTLHRHSTFQTDQLNK